MSVQFQFLPVQDSLDSCVIPQLCVVGEQFNKDVKTWSEATVFNYTASGCHLLLSFRNPTASERKAFSGPARFALFRKYDLLFFLFKFGDMPWQYAPYSYWLVPEEIRPDPDADLKNPGNRMLMTCFFINAATGILEEMRALSLSPAFTTRLLQCVKEQAQKPVTIGEQSLAVARINQQYPTPKAMVRDSLVQCWGGDW